MSFLMALMALMAHGTPERGQRRHALWKACCLIDTEMHGEDREIHGEKNLCRAMRFSLSPAKASTPEV